MKTIMDMAREAGFCREHINTFMCTGEDIKNFADLIRADEREACAKLADDCSDNIGPFEFDIGAQLAAAIRARGQA
jgi:hypothetical protein